MSKRLFLLQVAIDDYPPLVGRLAGCVNDAKYFHEFINERYGMTFDIEHQLLKNHLATRENIIEAIRSLKKASSGDVCIFHYSGHGTQVDAPKEFAHLEPDNKLEALVPYDSDAKGYLLDKELAYLVGEVTKDKNIHFTAIMDCCHSGTITRDEKTSPIKIKRAGRTAIEVKEVLGIEHFKETGKGIFAPPRARHFLLSACKANEKAKEIMVGDEPRGAFTFCLIRALSKAGKKLTYQELMQRIVLLMGKMIKDQTPRLELYQNSDKDIYFLSNDAATGETYFNLSNNKVGDELIWSVSAGNTWGIVPSNDRSDTIFRLKDAPQIPLRVEKVLSNRTIVSGMDNRRGEIFDVILESLAVEKVSVRFKDNVPAEVQENIREACTNQSFFFALEEGEPDPFSSSTDWNYFIQSDGKDLWLSLPDSDQALFRGVPIKIDPKGQAFLLSVNKVARWTQILLLNNPTPQRLDQSYFEIEMVKTKIPNQYNEDTAVEDISLDRVNSEEVFLPFLPFENRWYAPAFKLKIKNTSNTPLWFSVLYMESNFAISNELMPSIYLSPGEDASLEYKFDNTLTNIIQVWVEDHLHKMGTISLHDYLKVFVSSEDPNTNDLYQEGLPPDIVRIKRGYGRNIDPIESEWLTVNIPLHIHRPVESALLASGKAVNVHTLSILGPKPFSAKVRLNEYDVATKKFKDGFRISFGDNYFFSPFIILPGLYSAKGLNVIEFIGSQNEESITKAKPLLIKFNETGYIPKDGEIIPVTYTDEQGFIPLAYVYKDGILSIFEAPALSPSPYGDIDNTRKIFLHQLEIN